LTKTNFRYLVAVGLLAIPFKAEEVREVAALLKCLDFCLVPMAMVLISTFTRLNRKMDYFLMTNLGYLIVVNLRPTAKFGSPCVKFVTNYLDV
jgi:hypothetical protein